MEKIEPGKYVELGYDLYAVAPDGTEKLVHQTDEEDPEKIVFGVTRGVIVPLEKAIDGLKPGDKFDVKATAEEAFGPYDPEAVLTLDKDLFFIDGKFDAEHIKEGEAVPMMTADGFRVTGIVLAVTDDKVKMDFNHPLAGKNVRFDGKVYKVREATPEELHPASGCGCGEGSCDCGEGSCDCEGEGGHSCGCKGCH